MPHVQHLQPSGVSYQLTPVTGIKPTVPLSAIDKENSIRVLARFLSTYIQTILFTGICTYA